MATINTNKVGQIAVIGKTAYRVTEVDSITGEITLDVVSNDFEMDRNSIDQRVTMLREYASKIGIVESLSDRNSFEMAISAYMGDR